VISIVLVCTNHEVAIAVCNIISAMEKSVFSEMIGIVAGSRQLLRRSVLE